MTEESTKEVYVKVFSNEEMTKYCAQISSGKYVVCDINDPESYFDTTTFSTKPPEFTHHVFLTWDELIDSHLRWLLFGIGTLDNHENEHEFELLGIAREEDDHLISMLGREGWQIVFPVSSNRLYLHNPPMFYTTENALSVS